MNGTTNRLTRPTTMVVAGLALLILGVLQPTLLPVSILGFLVMLIGAGLLFRRGWQTGTIPRRYFGIGGVIGLVLIAMAATGAIGGRDQPSYDAGYANGMQQGQVYKALTGEPASEDAISLRCYTTADIAETHGDNGGPVVLKAGEVDAGDFHDGCVVGYMTALGMR
jgi:hypothetical protein